MPKTWADLVEYYYSLADPELSAAKRSAADLVFRAAKLVSLESYFLDGYGIKEVGELGRLVYTTVVAPTYSLYYAAWYYPFEYCYSFGLDFREDWPIFEGSPPIEFWLRDFMPVRDWQFFYDAIESILEEEEEENIVIVMNSVASRLPGELQQSIELLEQVIDSLSTQVQEKTTELVELLNRVRIALDPMESQFVDRSTSNPFIPIKKPPGSGVLTVFPDPSQADTAVNLEELSIYPNLFDLVCVSVHLLAAYLGADRLPRPWLPTLSSEAEPQWQVNNLADLIGQLHAEFRESSFVNAEIRSQDGEEVEQIKTNLGSALGLVLAALRDVSLDCEKTLALAVQAAQASLTAVAQLGTKTENLSVDLGEYRGQVVVPVSTGASLAQQIHALEILCSAIALQLGVSLKPS